MENSVNAAFGFIRQFAPISGTDICIYYIMHNIHSLPESEYTSFNIVCGTSCKR